MIPQYVRVVFPSNPNFQVLVPSQQSTLQYPRSFTSEQIRLINPIGSVVQSSSQSSSSQANNPVPNSSSSSLIVRQQAPEKTSSCQTLSSLSSTSNDAASKQNIMQANLISDTSTNSGETMSSISLSTSTKQCNLLSSNMNKANAKKSLSIIESDDRYQRKNKRAKNWTEEESLTFIGLWSEYYDSLMAGGARNTPIYNSMAQQLNQLLTPRIMNGSDVKAKIFNLVSEYRKKKKEQGKTGGSPSSWRYFDQIDKLLGERPYNDDSLMSDTMAIMQEDELLGDVENVSINHSNVQSFVDEGDQLSSLIKDIEEKTKENHSSNSNNSSNSTFISKNTVQHTTDSVVKKNYSSKKKKVSDVRIDLMQKMLVKIDEANEMANRAESKALALLEKQTNLQEESLNNEKEFLNLFRNIANNFNQGR